MKNQIRILVYFLAIVFLSLFIGCSAERSDDNQISFKENTSNENISENVNVPSENSSEVGNLFKCSNECNPLNCINNSPASLKKQFQDSKIKLHSYERKKLTFKGFIDGFDGNNSSKNANFHTLLKRFDDLRKENCAEIVSFEGNDTQSNFEWIFNFENSRPSPSAKDCREDIETYLNQWDKNNQINRNLYYTYNEITRELKFEGYIYERNGKDRFASLVKQLQNYLKNGCISKVTFAPRNEKEDKRLLNRGFEWRICEAGQCECNGICQSCNLCKKDTVNTNINSSNSNSP